MIPSNRIGKNFLIRMTNMNGLISIINGGGYEKFLVHNEDYILEADLRQKELFLFKETLDF